MALDHDIDAMGMQPLLRLMPREALRILAFAAESRILTAGEILFRKADPADCGYLVRSGAVALDDGSVDMQVARHGYLIGETALFADTTRPATAIAREATSLIKLNRSVMTRVLGEFPEAAAHLHGAIGTRVASLSGELAKVGTTLAAVDQ